MFLSRFSTWIEGVREPVRQRPPNVRLVRKTASVGAGQVVFIADNPRTRVRQSFDDLSSRADKFKIEPVQSTQTSKSSISSAPKAEDSTVWLSALGLKDGASWEHIHAAHQSLVADLTPGSGASHSKVELAERLLAEVNEAYDALRLRHVA